MGSASAGPRDRHQG